MTRLLRTTVFLTLTIFTAAVRVAPMAAQTTNAPTAPEGKWTGTVTAEMGQMKLAATLRLKDGAIAGELQTAHGVFTIAKGVVKDGKWVLPFTTEDGSSGTMTGVVSGDTFAGDWNFAPMAVGTFSLKKTTPGVVSGGSLGNDSRSR